ncbi:MAG TPA: GNAT family N-acetyltransferase [Thermoanaerobaculia bacterium]|nr:GNAT family N-acetyltransferase [Thermoanaerobaculia bacterium]
MPLAPLRLDHTRPEITAEIHRVMMAAYRIEAELLGVSDFFPLRRTVEQILSASSLFFGAFADDRLAAVAEIEAEEDPVNIASLVVDPDHFRKGLATRLLHFLLSLYRDRDLTVSTGILNRPALSLYDKLGFREYRRWSTNDGIPMITLLLRRQ